MNEFGTGLRGHACSNVPGATRRGLIKKIPEGPRNKGMENWVVTTLRPQHDQTRSGREQGVSDRLQLLSGLYGELGVFVPDIQFKIRAQIHFDG